MGSCNIGKPNYSTELFLLSIICYRKSLVVGELIKTESKKKFINVISGQFEDFKIRLSSFGFFQSLFSSVCLTRCTDNKTKRQLS